MALSWWPTCGLSVKVVDPVANNLNSFPMESKIACTQIGIASHNNPAVPRSLALRPGDHHEPVAPQAVLAIGATQTGQKGATEAVAQSEYGGIVG